MREKIELSAVRHRDMRNVLNEYGLSQKIDNGELICPSCLEILTWDNLGGFIVIGRRPKLFCSLTECMEAVKGGR